jgi:hypothetical protein
MADVLGINACVVAASTFLRCHRITATVKRTPRPNPNPMRCRAVKVVIAGLLSGVPYEYGNDD